jgi:3-hydroxyisobutyrate dehydrogenase-like beta-hydroxyacid dehydrogenase
MTMKIGVIGLGAMGSGLAESLLRAGHEVVAWNRSKAPLEPLRVKGARAADAPADAFAADAVVTMLANDEAVREVILDGGLLKHADGGTVHVMSATISVALARNWRRCTPRNASPWSAPRCWDAPTWPRRAS